MRVPIRHLAGHLLWSAQGGVWAIYRLHPGPDTPGAGADAVQGTYVPVQVRDELLARATQLVRSLSGAPRLYGLCARVDPGEVVLQMLEGVDPLAGGAARHRGQHPWAETAEAALDVLEGQEMHRRTLWLAVPLNTEKGQPAWTSGVGTVWSGFSAQLGLAPAAVPRREVAAFHQRAAQVEAQLSGAVASRPARPAEVVWMVQHALRRGLPEPLLAEAESSPLYDGQLEHGWLRSPSYADLGQVRLLEGGIDPADQSAHVAEDDDRNAGGRRGLRGSGSWWRREDTSPLRRRWLQVETEDGCGYQAHLALAECPKAIAVEAADLLAQLEGLAFPVDYCVDLNLVPAEKAKAQVERKKNELVDQAEQYDVRPAGMPHTVPEAARDLSELDARLSRTSIEVEVQSVTVLSVWAARAADCDARARALAALLAGADYRAVRPTGLQEALFTLGLPGTVRPPALREFTQHQVSEDWAMNGALTLTEAGDPNGMLLGFDQDIGTTRPVLLNIADAPKADASASFAVSGDPGGGKSVLLKLLTQSTVDRGGRAICIDRTPVREWATFARAAAPHRCQIIDAAAAGLSIDPLRMFPGTAQGAHYALSYLALQLGIGPMTAAGGVLHRAVEQAAQDAAPSMRQVLDHLQIMANQGSGARTEAAATLVDLMQIVASHPLAQMVFDPALPPVRLEQDLDCDLIVITTAGLTLPPKEAFAHPEVLRQQPLEALIGRAVLYLIAALARQTAFADPDRFCAIVADELWWLTGSAEGTALISEILHDGRKHNGGLFAGAQDEKELGPDRGLFAYRALSRTQDRALARRGLEFIGLDSTAGDLLRIVTTDLSPLRDSSRKGEMLLTAPRNNTCRVKVAIPRLHRIQSGITTTPGEHRATPGERPAPAAAPASDARAAWAGLAKAPKEARR
ncbi:ATP-binding protein [Streptomyces sp. NPDC001691]|uniref:ATP-binding protein n=1 Tax=Streptomyces sp. NPDC001691 TaxID=3364600 RepID=UPI0036CBDEA5